MAFLIVDVTEVSKEPIYAEYRHRAPTTLAAQVGTHLIRGGQVDTFEGNWRPERVVIVRFESADRPQLVPRSNLL